MYLCILMISVGVEHNKMACMYVQRTYFIHVMYIQPTPIQTELCSKVPMECTYCKLHIILSDFVQHEEYCGSQTEPCSDCLRPICRKDMLTHLTECTGEPVRVQPSSSNNDAYFSDSYDNDLTCKKLCAVVCCLCCCWSCLCCCWNKFKITREL